MTKHRVNLGPVQQTPPIPLYGHAAENRKDHPALRDARGGEIAAALDHHFTPFEGLPSLTGTVLRAWDGSRMTDTVAARSRGPTSSPLPLR
ncbi:hypothetical protein [Streptomyces sp. TS71-3]|uniref:hypothetical protein n=1 Tax=Streptomyces sp. TS71-3 TaxID=2733862 RepID=UPI001BB35CEF|nr:hypothetical protein [Streptomyces sp. TS71-3]